jgi:hypothetical protein
MTVQEIADYIQSRINGAAHNEQLANEQWHQTEDSARRAAAYNLSQISTAQRLALQDVLDAIQGVQA